MLLCKEQKNPIVFNGRELLIAEKALNAHFKLCNLPVTEVEVSVYLGTALKKEKEKLSSYTTEQLGAIVEEGIWDEFTDLCGKEAWDSVPC